MTLRPEPYRHLEREAVFDRLEALAAEAAARAVPMGALAIAWALAHPLMDAVIIGPRTPAHIDIAVQGAALALGEADRQRIGALMTA